MNRAFAFILILTLIGLQALGEMIVVESDQAISYCTELEYIEDNNNALTITEIEDDDSTWSKCQSQSINFGHSKNYWFRFTFKNPDSHPITQYINFSYPKIDLIRFFHPVGSKYYIERIGDQSPFSQRRVKDRRPIVKLIVIPGETTYYFNVSTAGSLHFKFLAMSEKGYFKSLNTELPILWAFFGFMGALIIFNILMFISNGKKSYIYFVFVLLSAALTEFGMRGFALQYLWPESVQWSNNSSLFFLGNYILWFTLFLNKYLRIKKYANRLYRASIALFIIPGALIIINSFIISSFRAFMLVTLSLLILSILYYMTVLVYFTFFKKQRNAQYAMAACSVFLLSLFVPVLVQYGIIYESMFTEVAHLFGYAFLALFFAFALGQNIEILSKNLKVQQKELYEKNLYITEQNMELIESNRAAQEAVALKSAFLANLSHEIRTPLNGILGFSDLLSQPDISSKEREEYNNLITDSGEKLTVIIDDIIDISKIELKQLDTYKTEFNLLTLVEEVYSKFLASPKLKTNNLELRLILDIDEEIRLYSDRDRLEQALSNLLSNAIKFTDEGYIDLKCEDKTFDDKILFAVEDSGPGIPIDQQNTIFEIFTKASPKEHKLHQGLGLGLAISKNIANMLGGKIWFETQIGKGTTFFFSIDK